MCQGTPNYAPAMLTLLALLACDGPPKTGDSSADSGSGPPQLCSLPTTIDFGTVPVGTGATSALTLGNCGGGTVTISDARISGSTRFSTDSTVLTSLEAGHSIEALVTYSPVTTYGDNARLTLTTNDPAAALVTIGLDGNGDYTFPTEQLWNAGTDDWEPFVAAKHGIVAEVTTRISTTDSYIAVRTSTDGGVTFSPDQRLEPDGVIGYDPQIAIAKDTGSLYALWLGDNWDTHFLRSDDGGATWTDPVNIAPNWSTDHGFLAVSDDGQDVYVGWNGSTLDDYNAGLTDWRGYVSASHDGGVTWGDPWVVGDGGDYYWFQTAATIAPSGDVYFAASEYTHDYSGPTHLGVWRSTDKGATFTVDTFDSAGSPPTCEWAEGCATGFFASQVGMTADAAGALTVLYQYSANDGDPQAMLVRTSPGGDAWQDWSDPVTVSTTTEHNGFPSVAAGPTAGDVRLLWQGSVPGDPTHFNTWTDHTTDGGLTWDASPTRLSDDPGSAVYKSPDGYPFPYGDYVSVAIDDDGVAHTIWGESPGYDGPGGTWDAVIAP